MQKRPRRRTPRSVLVTALLATVVTAGALVTAVWLRQEAAQPPGAAPTTVSAPGSGCGDGPCTQIAATTANGEQVELLVDSAGAGRIRFGEGDAATVQETALSNLGVELNGSSLSCTDGAVAACLVRGPHEDGLVGEVFVGSDGSWASAGRPYLSDADGIVLDDVTGGDPQAAEIVVVRHDCSRTGNTGACQQAPVLAEVYDLDGRSLGCTRTYRSPSRLPGWPEVRLSANALRDCP